MISLFKKNEQHNPLHEAILANDLTEFQKHIGTKEYHTHKNAWGLTPADLAKCFHRRDFFTYFDLKTLLPPFIKNGERQPFTEVDLPQKIGITYLHHLEFESVSALRWVIKNCQRALDEDLITKEQKWLGSYYQKEITSLFVPSLEIRWIDNTLGWGVFAAKDFAAKDYIGEYTGYLRRRKKRRDQKNSYCFEYLIGESEPTPYTIDAKDRGNYTRFINHSDTPNCDPMLIYAGGIMRVIIYTNQRVKKGTQLTYDYGPDYWAKREKPI